MNLDQKRTSFAFVGEKSLPLKTAFIFYHYIDGSIFVSRNIGVIYESCMGFEVELLAG